MLKTTLSDPKIVTQLNELVVAVKVYKEDSNYPKNIASRYTPTIFFLDSSNHNLIRPILGYWDAESFTFYIKDLRCALAKRKQN